MVQPVDIGPEETSGQLFDRVAAVGAETLCRCIEEIAAGRAVPTPQDHEKATLAPPLTKEMARFAFEQPAQVIHDQVRGMNPWPAAYFECEGKKVKVLDSRVHPGEEAAPGTVLSTKPLVVQCGASALELCQVVPEGKKPMEGTAWAAGRRLKPGMPVV